MDDLSEKEQLELMRSWWAENGRYVIGGLALGIAILYGWNSWRDSIANEELAASDVYEEVMTGVGDGDAELAETSAAILFGEHGDSVYAAQGRLAMARMYMDMGRDQDAAEVLQALVDAGTNTEIGMIARLRLAQILLYQDKPEDVIVLLEPHRDNAFAPRYNELLGDAYTATGAYDEALTAYTEAQSVGRVPAVVDTELIQLKINDLPAQDQVDAIQAPAESSADAAAETADDATPAEDTEDTAASEEDSQ